MKVSYPIEYNRTDRLVGDIVSEIKGGGGHKDYLIKTHDNKYVQVPESECIILK